ncbi:protein kinase-like domain-containing protein [Artemisia annua]|uniref:Protein kinase-like domain-containing protein n=1 Tax=Artemisia annua TaxID=35608 RepID=A0A2U1NHY7_ARTAN|nr:protein kinase-like domain-containing protein [Artemisia annua]
MEDFPCYETCINTPGDYICECKEGYSGDGKIPNDCRREPFNVLGLSIAPFTATCSSSSVTPAVETHQSPARDLTRRRMLALSQL